MGGRDFYLLSHFADGADGQMEGTALVAKKAGSRCEPGYSRELTGSLEPALAVAERERGGATLAHWRGHTGTLHCRGHTGTLEGPH